MTVFTCEETFEAMMTCIYEAWASRLGHENLRLQLEPVGQQGLFCTYIHVDTNISKASSVIRSIQRKISFTAYQQVFLAAMSFEPDRLDAIYRFLVLGFAAGRKVTDMLFRPEVVWILELSRKTGHEAAYFREFTRFFRAGQVYVAHIEPKCNITSISAGHFADRMPSEYWMLIDDNRQIAAVHPKNQPFYMMRLTGEEMKALREAEEAEDQYTDLWREFFHSTGIEARKNYECQRSNMPIWYRKHAVEFRESKRRAEV